MSLHPNKAQKAHEKNDEKSEQTTQPRIIDHPLLRESERAIVFHFGKRSHSLKISVLDKKQSQVRIMIKAKKEV